MDNYLIEGKIGEGAHGVVLKAKKISSGTTVRTHGNSSHFCITPDSHEPSCNLMLTFNWFNCRP